MSRTSKAASSSSGIGGMFKSLTKSFKGTAIQSGSSQADKAAAGAPDLPLLLEKAKKHNSTNERIKAAECLQESIDTFSVSSIVEIWNVVSDMVSSDFSPECRRVGIKLMISCIQKGNPNRSSRLGYYNCIVNTSNLQDFDLQLEAMKALTENGSNLNDFFQAESRLSDVLTAWFRHLSSETQEIRIGRKSDIAKSWGNSMEDNFHALLRFIVDVFRHSQYLFSDRDIYYLVQEATLTCRKTSSETDMDESLRLVDTIISCAFIPIENLPSLLEVLCGVAGIPSRADQAWDIILCLSKSYISNNTFACLCKILEATRKSEVNSNTMRGAARYLERLVGIYAEQKREAEIPIIRVMHAYNASLVIDSLRHYYEICSCILNLLEDKATRERFTYEIWESRDYSPLEIIYRISNTPAILKFASHPISTGKAASISMLSSLSLTSNGDRSQAHHTVRRIVEKFKQIFALIADISENGEFNGPKEVIIDFFVDMSPYIDERCALIVIDHFKTSHYCNPLSPNWINNSNELLHRFFQDMTWGATVRQRVLQVIEDTYDIAKEICEPSKIIELISKVFRNVEDEPDNHVLETMVQMFEEIAKEATHEVLDHISVIFLQFFNDGFRRKSITSYASTAGNEFGMTSHLSSGQPAGTGVAGVSHNGVVSPLLSGSAGASLVPGGSPVSQQYTQQEYRKQIIASAFCKTFVNTFRTSAVKARITYSNLLSICQRTSNDPLAYIEVARLLCRIRVSSENYIYLTTPNSMDGLATSLGRNLTEVEDPSTYKSTMAWWYPEEVSYISDEDLDVPSWVLKKYSDDSSEFGRLKGIDHEINISSWYIEMLRIIEHGAHWEIYSFVWAHLGPQLSNIQLFRGSGCDIHRLRQILCDQASGPTRPPQVIFPKDVARTDIKVVSIQTMPFLIPYHDMFAKRDEDLIVKALVEGLSMTENAYVPSIHALLICCYELPLSIKKYLAQIFTKFQMKMTNSSISPRILEFLLSLARLPSLTENFTQSEYKVVFGLAIKYIQYAHDLTASKSDQPIDLGATGPAPITGASNPFQITVDPLKVNSLCKYFLFIAYNVVATWFLTLRVTDRKYMAKFIIRNLILAEGGPDYIDTQSLAYVDLISRFTYSNLDLTVQTALNTEISNSSGRVMKQWIYGSSIVTISTDPQTGESQILIRRPTGTTVLNLKPDEKMIPGWLEQFVLKLRDDNEFTSAGQRLRSDTYTTFTPNYLFLQLMISLNIEQSVKPIPIPEDVITLRALSTIDCTPVVDFHKIAIVYIEPRQHGELEILGSSSGSLHYKRFLNGIGKLVRLKENRKIYTERLDITNDIDGDYAIVWNDKVTQLLFHTTTMMPAASDAEDSAFSSKKRHVGNDSINILFDESELPFEFGEEKTQFSFINIVISPIPCSFPRASTMMESNMESEPISPTVGPIGGQKRDEGSTVNEAKMFYRVQVLCKPGVPSLFSACQLKILSEESLPVFVRNLAHICSMFATVWNSPGTYLSNWQYRLEQITTLREKILTEINKTVSGSSGIAQPAPSPQHTHKRGDSMDKKEESNVTQSFLDQLTNNDTSITRSFLDQLTSSEPTETVDKTKDPAPAGVPIFHMDEPEGQDDDMPLLKHLDFSSFT